ncbi:MAG: DUF1116 domain-containing protein [Firmicutes bacterium]|nr:DUF1116 domain-containing protein [Bacillota bacterium]
MLVDVVYAKELPGMTKTTIGHAGPPLKWDDMCGPLQGAVLGAIVYEGLAETLEEAEGLVLAGKVNFKSNHELSAVGPMTGMITYSMPLWKVENTKFGNVAYSTFNEGLGKVMRFGANGPDVIERLKWLEKVLAPALKNALKSSGPIALRVLMAKALAMGDEMHQRNTGATSLFIRDIMPHVIKTEQSNPDLEKIVEFVTGNDQFFLNLAMAGSKAIMDPVKNIPHSTVVTAMSRNGTNFGVKISALGDTWFEAPVNQPEGLYFPGYSEKDANPDIGDSAIVETIGIGGFAMGASPAVVRFVGASSMAEALQYSQDMQLISVGLSTTLILPTMDFIGTATAIDARKVVETGILPVINTGMAHKQPGVGQVGAGIVKAPLGCFEQAVEAFAEQL